MADNTTTTEPHDTADHASITPAKMDTILAKELNRMSFREREQVYEEIHGVEEIMEETPNMLALNLKAIQEEIDAIASKPAYDTVLQDNPFYVLDPAFRLMFLRANYFLPRAAAKSLVAFLEAKLEYFGREVLSRPIYITDLDKESLLVLKSGANQILPARDRAGRAIFADLNLLVGFKVKNPESVAKLFIYMIMAILEDEETQKRGVVGLFYFVGSKSLEFDREVNKKVSPLLECLPFRFTALHICFDDPRLRMFKALLLLTMGRDRRIRVRIHDGTHVECKYSLMTFGVPVQCLPVLDSGEVKTTSHMKWVAKRKIKDTACRRGEAFHGIDLPAAQDILVARGKPVGDHMGNMRLRNLVYEYVDAYDDATKQEKTAIAMRIVTLSKQYPCRFLKRNSDGWWTEVSDEVARGKVSTCFRSVRSQILAAQQTRAKSLNLDTGKRIRVHWEPPNTSSPCGSFPCF